MSSHMVILKGLLFATFVLSHSCYGEAVEATTVEDAVVNNVEGEQKVEDVENKPAGDPESTVDSTITSEGDMNNVDVEGDDVAANATGNTTKAMGEYSRVMEMLTYVFVSEIYDGRTFSAKDSGASKKRGAGVNTAFRVGNLEVIGDADKARKALKKQLANSLILVHEAPEDGQYHPKEHRNAVAEAKGNRHSRQYLTSAEREALDAAASPDEKKLTPEEETALLYGVDEATGHWKNITVVDAWSFDGWHVAVQLAEKHPQLFSLVAEDKRYAVHHDITREAEDADEEETEEEKAEEGKNDETSADGEALVSSFLTEKKKKALQKLHILSARSSIKRQKAYEKVAKAMKETLGVDAADAEEAAALLEGLAGSKKYKKGKKAKAAGASEEEASWLHDKVPQLVGLSIVFVLGMGVFLNFGRPAKKWKTKPSKNYIMKEMKSL